MDDEAKAALRKMEQRVHSHIDQVMEQVSTLANKVANLEQASRVLSSNELHLSMQLGIIANELTIVEAIISKDYPEIEASIRQLEENLKAQDNDVDKAE